MIGAIILGLLAGGTARLLIKNDAMERMGGLLSWMLTLVVGLVGAWAETVTAEHRAQQRETGWTSSPA